MTCKEKHSVVILKHYLFFKTFQGPWVSATIINYYYNKVIYTLIKVFTKLSQCCDKINLYETNISKCFKVVFFPNLSNNHINLGEFHFFANRKQKLFLINKKLFAKLIALLSALSATDNFLREHFCDHVIRDKIE